MIPASEDSGRGIHKTRSAVEGLALEANSQIPLAAA